MDTPNLQRARLYAAQRLQQELPAALTYPCLAHTLQGVVPAVERLAALEGVNGQNLLLLRTAAYYHDLGFVERADGHLADMLVWAGLHRVVTLYVSGPTSQTPVQ